MEEQNKKTVGMMYPDSPGKQFWHIWGPLIIKMGIGFIISSIAAAIFGVYYLCRHYGINAEVLADARQMQIISERFMRDSMELAQTISLKFYDYTTLVDGVASLITIPVMWLCFTGIVCEKEESDLSPTKRLRFGNMGQSLLWESHFAWQ